MTPQEAIDYIEQYTWSTTRLGLERTQALLRALGDPQKKLKFIHVAGSNGKGSTCAMLAAILQAAGYRTGLYISPYIQDFCERMQVNGENVPGDTLAAITERVRTIADAMEDHPSQFELVTAIALEFFFEAKCDIVVLEVGMGGALDSTNAIDAPEVAVITKSPRPRPASSSPAAAPSAMTARRRSRRWSSASAGKRACRSSASISSA